MKKQQINSIGLCLFEIIVGILLLINPIGFTSGIIVAAGIILVILGLANILKYFRTDAIDAVSGHYLSKGLIALLFGLFCTFNSHWFIATFPLLTIIYGIIMLITGLSKIEITVDLIRTKHKKWFIAAISAVLSIICAVTILNSPFSSTAVLWMFTGISLIAESVIDIFAIIMSRKEEEKE